MRANKFANFVLIGGLLFFGMILAYVFYRIIYANLNLFFAVIPFVGILICSFAFKLRPDYKINFVLTGLSIFFVVFFAEIVLFFYPNIEAKRINQAKKMGISFDTRTRLKVIDELKKQGVDAVPFLFPNKFIKSDGLERANGEKIFPVGAISQKTTVFCNENGKYTIYESDEHGFNNPKGLFEVDKIDLILIGDSFTHGACVRQGEDIASQLRRMSELRVISLGSIANGPLVEFATLKEYGQPLRPKYVLWMYYEQNDLDDLKLEQTSFLLKYRDGQFSQHLITRQSEIDFLLGEYLQKWKVRKRKIHPLRILKLYNLRKRLGFMIIQQPPPFSLFTELLEKANFLTSSWGGQLYFVYLPSWERYAKDVEHGTFQHRNRVLSIVKHLNIPIIDMHEKVFAVHPDPVSLFPLGFRDTTRVKAIV